MTNTFAADWSPRNAWNFEYIRNGTLIETSPAATSTAGDTTDDTTDDTTGFRYWRRSVALVVDVLGRRFPDALAAVREALVRARADQSGPYARDSDTAVADLDNPPLPL